MPAICYIPRLFPVTNIFINFSVPSEGEPALSYGFHNALRLTTNITKFKVRITGGLIDIKLHFELIEF